MTHTGSPRRFSQVDVFAPGPKAGNPVAVIHDADGCSTEQMLNFANWTNLSETTFLLKPTDPAADYRLRIFTPRAKSPSPGTPRWDPRRRGWTTAESPRTGSSSSRSAAPGW